MICLFCAVVVYFILFCFGVLHLGFFLVVVFVVAVVLEGFVLFGFSLLLLRCLGLSVLF